jgi:hypothetical protein
MVGGGGGGEGEKRLNGKICKQFYTNWPINVYYIHSQFQHLGLVTSRCICTLPIFVNVCLAYLTTEISKSI